MIRVYKYAYVSAQELNYPEHIIQRIEMLCKALSKTYNVPCQSVGMVYDTPKETLQAVAAWATEHGIQVGTIAGNDEEREQGKFQLLVASWGIPEHAEIQSTHSIA